MKAQNITSLFYIRIFIISFLFLLPSCTTITDTLFVQDVKVKGPINQPPVRVTGRDSSTFTISPKFFINSKRTYEGLIEGHTPVNSTGVFQYDTVTTEYGNSYRVTPNANNYEFEGKNLYWSIPDYFVGLDIDIAISRKIALSGGFSLSGRDKTNLYGYRLGLGFFSTSGNIGIRFDGGLIWQKYSYDASSVIIREEHPDFGSGSPEIIFYRDKGYSTNLNHYLSLTINTLYYDLPVNFLLNAGYSGQSLVDYEPNNADDEFHLFDPYYRVEDMRGEAYAAFLNISPGIFANINESSRIIFAARFFFEVSFEESQNSTFIIPMIQLDLGL